MEKISERVMPGLWTSERWDIGHGYTVLVEARDAISTMRVMGEDVQSDSDAKQPAYQPPHWKTNQTVDVTEKIAGLVSFGRGCDLVPSGLILADDSVATKHLECPAGKVMEVLRQMEMAVGVMQKPELSAALRINRALGGEGDV